MLITVQRDLCDMYIARRGKRHAIDVKDSGGGGAASACGQRTGEEDAVSACIPGLDIDKKVGGGGGGGSGLMVVHGMA